MKLERKFRDIEGSIAISSKQVKISEKDMDKLWEAIENPYKDPIGSIVREYTSNAFDSHKDAGVDDSVIVKLGRDEAGYYISFIDVGTGMSPQLMDEVFTNVYASTKDDSDDFIGAYGMGSKAGLSYSDLFYINTHVNGTTYNYIYRKGEIRPSLDLVFQFDEKRRNGTEFKIAIQNDSDMVKFIRACERQLYYFTNVVFDYQELIEHIPSNYGYTLNREFVENVLNNDYKIYEGKTFRLRMNKNNRRVFSNLHLLNGPVNYPIDFNYIQSEHLHKVKNLDIGLKFEIGELEVIQTREDIKYKKQKVIDNIQNQIESFYQELKDLYDKSILDETDDILYFIKNFDKVNYLTFGNDEYEYSINIFDNKSIKYTPLDNIKEDYSLRYMFINALLKDINISREIINKNNIVRNYSKTLSTNLANKIFKQSYDVTRYYGYSKTNNYSVKINKQILLKDYPHLKSLDILKDSREKRDLRFFKINLDLNKHPKHLWRSIIKVFLEAEEELIKILLKKNNGTKLQLIDVDNITLDKKWYIEYQKNNRVSRKKIDNSLISINERSLLTKTWNNESIKFKDFNNQASFIIIEVKENKSNLLYLSSLLKYSYSTSKSNNKINNLKLFAISQRNYDKILKERDDKSRIFTYKEFMENKNDIKFEILKELYFYVQIKNEPSIIKILNNSNFLHIITCIFPKLQESFIYIKELHDNMLLNFQFRDERAVDKLLVDLKKLEDFVKFDKKDFSENFKIVSHISYNFYPLIKSLKDSSYYNPDYNINLLSLYLNLYLTKSTKLMMHQDIYKSLSDTDYDKLISDDNLSLVDKIRVNLYEIKNQKQLTEYKKI